MQTINKTVLYADVDYSGRLKMTTLFQLLTTLATEDAIALGIWSMDMMDSYGWIVSKQTMELDEDICLHDEIEITTYADKGSFVIFPRYYIIKKNNRIIGKISSVWTLLDLKKRMIIAPKRIGIKMPDINHNIKLKAPKTIDKDLKMKLANERKVLYSDVDTNQHMNNTRYIEWALDLLDFDIFKEKYIYNISINYLKEIKPLEDVQLYLSKELDIYNVKGVVNNEIAFMIEILFKSIIGK